MCVKFRDYLFYAPHFTIYTDNNPLTYVMSTAKLNIAGHGWVGELADFRFKIKYMCVDADTLSRLPLDTDIYVTYVAAINLAQSELRGKIQPLMKSQSLNK